MVRNILSKKVKLLDRKIYTAIETELGKIACVPQSKVDAYSGRGKSARGNQKKLALPPGSLRIDPVVEDTMDDSISDELSMV